MSGYLNTLFYGVYPYIALVVLAVGTVIRYDREPYTWRSGSSQLLRRKQLVWGSVLFHVGVLVVFFGHVVGLLTPIWIFEMLGISHTAKQLMAITVGGIFGAMAIVGATMLAHRRLFDARVRAASSASDTAIILLLWAQLALGLATIPISAQHLDGSEMVLFMSWAQGHLQLRSGSVELHHRCGAHLQAASVPGADDIVDLPLHPPRAHAERAGALSLAAGLSGGARQGASGQRPSALRRSRLGHGDPVSEPVADRDRPAGHDVGHNDYSRARYDAFRRNRGRYSRKSRSMASPFPRLRFSPRRRTTPLKIPARR